jgi:putative hydrolase of the HAD superfamily
LGLPEWGLADAVFNNPVSREASLGRATAEDIWRWVGERFQLSPEDLARLRADFFRGDRLDEELLGLIRALRRRMPVGMITNAWPEMLHWLEEEWKIAHLFDPLIISAEVGLAKPDPRIYRLALQQLRLQPGQVLFIDDFIENIAAAQDLGMQTHHFKEAARLILQLRPLLDPSHGPPD